MGNRTAKFISAVFASVLAGVPYAAVSQNAPSAQTAPKAADAKAADAKAADPKAADDCLASPKGATPQGQHWYYRVERGTKRQCWYLRDEGPKAAQATQQDSQQTAQPPSGQTEVTAPAAAPAAAAHNVQDARAEWTSQPAAPVQAMPAQAAPTSIPAQSSAAAPTVATPRSNAASDGSAPSPAVAARWPDASAASPSPAPQPAPAATVADADPTSQDAGSSSPAPVTQATADASIAKPTASLQTLLLVIGGALALAGITGSLIYRFAGARVRVQANEGVRRRVNWDNWERELGAARAPWLDTPKAVPSPLPRPRLEDISLAVTDTKPASAASRIAAHKALADSLEAANAQAEATMPLDVEETKASTAPKSEATDRHTKETDADEDDIDINIGAITALLENLAKEGPRLDQPSPATRPAAFARSRQDRSDVRA